MKTNYGFTLVEVMVVIFIFTILFGAILTVLLTSDRNWRFGQEKLTLQQEARRAMDSITRLIRQSNPEWVINQTSYKVMISDNGKRIDFYQPVFDANGVITTLRKITFKPNPDNNRQLLKKEGIETAVVIGNEIENINFGGGCLGCTTFNCFNVATDCPVVEIELKTKNKKNMEFTLRSYVTLRNQKMILSEVEIEEPEEGEF